MKRKEVWDMKKLPCVRSKLWDLVSLKNVIMFESAEIHSVLISNAIVTVPFELERGFDYVLQQKSLKHLDL